MMVHGVRLLNFFDLIAYERFYKPLSKIEWSKIELKFE